MSRVGAADRLGRGLAEPDVQELALLDQLGHRADGLLDRHFRVHAVLVVEVDPVGAQALERSLDGAAHVLGRAIAHSRPLAVLVAHRAHAELRRDHVRVAITGDRLADELLVFERPVHLGGVEEVDAELQCPLDRRHAFVLVRAAVEGRHPHAAETDLRYLQAL